MVNRMEKATILSLLLLPVSSDSFKYGVRERTERGAYHEIFGEDEAFYTRELDALSTSTSSFVPTGAPTGETLTPTITTPAPTAPTQTPQPSTTPMQTVEPTSPLTTTEGVELEWFGQFAYFKASNVVATIDDGTVIRFVDDLNRPDSINSGGAGEEVSREDAWTEGGVERRVKFYFIPKPPQEDFSAEEARANGWHMYDARMYTAAGSDWVYWGGDYRNVSMVQTPPDGTALFYCDYFEVNYRLGGRDDSVTPGGKFVANNVTIGGYLQEGYDFQSMDVFNPCAAKYPEKDCRAIDGNVFCGDVALTLDDFSQA